ncbi:uPF0291 protein BACCAP_00627 [Clostridium sp. CAG:448]|nr:uPF0291 protein BACCAP_00627 [Clostridium sp. CAG:448]
MEQKKIDRINEFARRVRNGETLSDDELRERADLRSEYLREIRASLTNDLEHTVIVRPDGTVEHVTDKHPKTQKNDTKTHTTKQ